MIKKKLLSLFSIFLLLTNPFIVVFVLNVPDVDAAVLLGGSGDDTLLFPVADPNTPKTTIFNFMGTTSGKVETGVVTPSWFTGTTTDTSPTTSLGTSFTFESQYLDPSYAGGVSPVQTFLNSPPSYDSDSGFSIFGGNAWTSDSGGLFSNALTGSGNDGITTISTPYLDTIKFTVLGGSPYLSLGDSFQDYGYSSSELDNFLNTPVESGDRPDYPEPESDSSSSPTENSFIVAEDSNDIAEDGNNINILVGDLAYVDGHLQQQPSITGDGITEGWFTDTPSSGDLPSDGEVNIDLSYNPLDSYPGYSGSSPTTFDADPIFGPDGHLSGIAFTPTYGDDDFDLGTFSLIGGSGDDTLLFGELGSYPSDGMELKTALENLWDWVPPTPDDASTYSRPGEPALTLTTEIKFNEAFNGIMSERPSDIEMLENGQMTQKEFIEREQNRNSELETLKEEYGEYTPLLSQVINAQGPLLESIGKGAEAAEVYEEAFDRYEEIEGIEPSDSDLYPKYHKIVTGLDSSKLSYPELSALNELITESTTISTLESKYNALNLESYSPEFTETFNSAEFIENFEKLVISSEGSRLNKEIETLREVSTFPILSDAQISRKEELQKQSIERIRELADEAFWNMQDAIQNGNLDAAESYAEVSQMGASAVNDIAGARLTIRFFLASVSNPETRDIFTSLGNLISLGLGAAFFEKKPDGSIKSKLVGLSYEELKILDDGQNKDLTESERKDSEEQLKSLISDTDNEHLKAAAKISLGMVQVVGGGKLLQEVALRERERQREVLKKDEEIKETEKKIEEGETQYGIELVALKDYRQELIELHNSEREAEKDEVNKIKIAADKLTRDGLVEMFQAPFALGDSEDRKKLQDRVNSIFGPMMLREARNAENSKHNLHIMEITRDRIPWDDSYNVESNIQGFLNWYGAVVNVFLGEEFEQLAEDETYRHNSIMGGLDALEAVMKYAPMEKAIVLLEIIHGKRDTTFGLEPSDYSEEDLKRAEEIMATGYIPALNNEGMYYLLYDSPHLNQYNQVTKLVNDALEGKTYVDIIGLTDPNNIEIGPIDPNIGPIDAAVLDKVRFGTAYELYATGHFPESEAMLRPLLDGAEISPSVMEQALAELEPSIFHMESSLPIAIRAAALQEEIDGGDYFDFNMGEVAYAMMAYNWKEMVYNPLNLILINPIGAAVKTGQVVGYGANIAVRLANIGAKTLANVERTLGNIFNPGVIRTLDFANAGIQYGSLGGLLIVGAGFGLIDAEVLPEDYAQDLANGMMVLGITGSVGLSTGLKLSGAAAHLGLASNGVKYRVLTLADSDAKSILTGLRSQEITVTPAGDGYLVGENTLLIPHSSSGELNLGNIHLDDTFIPDGRFMTKVKTDDLGNPILDDLGIPIVEVLPVYTTGKNLPDASTSASIREVTPLNIDSKVNDPKFSNEIASLDPSGGALSEAGWTGGWDEAASKELAIQTDKMVVEFKTRLDELSLAEPTAVRSAEIERLTKLRDSAQKVSDRERDFQIAFDILRVESASNPVARAQLHSISNPFEIRSVTKNGREVFFIPELPDDVAIGVRQILGEDNGVDIRTVQSGEDIGTVAKNFKEETEIVRVEFTDGNVIAVISEGTQIYLNNVDIRDIIVKAAKQTLTQIDTVPVKLPTRDQVSKPMVLSSRSGTEQGFEVGYVYGDGVLNLGIIETPRFEDSIYVRGYDDGYFGPKDTIAIGNLNELNTYRTLLINALEKGEISIGSFGKTKPFSELSSGEKASIVKEMLNADLGKYPDPSNFILNWQNLINDFPLDDLNLFKLDEMLEFAGKKADDLTPNEKLDFLIDWQNNAKSAAAEKDVKPIHGSNPRAGFLDGHTHPITPSLNLKDSRGLPFLLDSEALQNTLAQMKKELSKFDSPNSLKEQTLKRIFEAIEGDQPTILDLIAKKRDELNTKLNELELYGEIAIPKLNNEIADLEKTLAFVQKGDFSLPSVSKFMEENAITFKHSDDLHIFPSGKDIERIQALDAIDLAGVKVKMEYILHADGHTLVKIVEGSDEVSMLITTSRGTIELKGTIDDFSGKIVRDSLRKHADTLFGIQENPRLSIEELTRRAKLADDLTGELYEARMAMRNALEGVSC